MNEREFASRARIGIAPPQSNPVVEPEMSVLLPDRVGMLVTRLTGSEQDPKKRFRQYVDNLETSLEAFGVAQLDAFGFACTAPAYLFGDGEAEALDRVSQRFGYPAISSAQAIRRALDHLGLERIALFSPYPDWLTEASRVYWQGCGYDLTAWATMPDDTTDTTNIYRIRTEGVLRAAEALETGDAEVVLMTGTGMPTLPAMPALTERTGKPILSSNLCLAWALLDELGLAESAPPRYPGEVLLGGWVPRLDRL
jgi:maleate isomerase